MYRVRKNERFVLLAVTIVSLSTLGCHHASRSGVGSSEDQISTIKASNEENFEAAKSAVSGNPHMATWHYRRALISDPNNPGLQFELAMSLKREGKYAEALPVFKEVTKSGDRSWSRPAKIETAFVETKLHSGLR